MKTLSDYVDWVANSMGQSLNEDQLRLLTNELIRNEKYVEVLRELEIRIFEIVEEGN